MIDVNKPLVVVHEDGSVEHVQLAKRADGKAWPGSYGDVRIMTSVGEIYFDLASGQRAWSIDTLRNATPDEIRAHVAAERARLSAMEAETNKPDAITLWWREWQARGCEHHGMQGSAADFRKGKRDQKDAFYVIRNMPGFIEYAEKCVKELGL